MPKITVDGKEYDTDQIPEKAKQQVISIQFVDRRIQELNAEIAAFQTARNAYGKALGNILKENN